MKFIKRKITFVLLGIFILGIIPFNMVMAERSQNKLQNNNIVYDAPNKEPSKVPNIRFEYQGITPQNPMVGQEITVRYKVTPEEFEILYPRKEIVLLLDMSGSMTGNKITKSKEALKTLIDSLKNEKNLYISLVTYNLYATPRKVNDEYLVSSYDSEEIIKIIDNIIKDGNKNSSYTYGENLLSNGTNIGDALRWATYILDNGEAKPEDKYIISMTDGQPTNWITNDLKLSNKKNILNSSNNKDVLWNVSTDYYTEIDGSQLAIGKKDTYTKPPYYAGEPTKARNDDLDGDKKKDNNTMNAWTYANQVARNINERKYNIFSVGCGFNQKYQAGNINVSDSTNGGLILNSIHNSAGGKGDTFFTVNADNMKEIYSKIAEQLKQPEDTKFKPIKFNFNKGLSAIYDNGEDSIKVNDISYKQRPILNSKGQEIGIQYYYETTDSNGNKVNYFYLEFKIKANVAGELNLFEGENYIEYSNIDGVYIKSDNLPNPVIKVEPYDPNKMLQISLPENNGYLIGDIASIDVSVTNPGINKNIKYENVRFDIENGVPDILELRGGNSILRFSNMDLGNKNSITETQNYTFNVLDNSEIMVDVDSSGNIQNSEKKAKLRGKLMYKPDHQEEVEAQAATNIKVRRGEIRVNFTDSNNRPIEGVRAEISNINEDEALGFDTEAIGNMIKFKTVPTGMYEIKITEAPTGYFTTAKKIVSVSYINNLAIVNIELTSVLPDIDANLIGDIEVFSNPNDNIPVSYEIAPKSFEKSEFDSVYKDFVVVLDTTSNSSNGKNKKVIEAFNDKIIEGFLKEKSSSRIGIVSFGKQQECENLTGELLEYTSYKSKEIDINSVIKEDNSNGYITNAIIEADRMLTDSNSINKTIVILALGDIDYSDTDINSGGSLESIKAKGYNIITASITDLAENNEENNTKLKELHRYLASKSNIEEEYLESSSKTSQDTLMDNLNKKLTDVMMSKFIIKGAYLHFTLPNGIEMVSDSNGSLTNDNRLLLEDIVYTVNGNNMISSTFNTEPFNVKANNYGKYEFGNSHLSYKGLDSITEINRKILTPTMIIEEINHGIYLGQGNINEKDSDNSFAKGAVVQMAAKFNTSGNGDQVNITIDPLLGVLGVPKIYNLSEDGKLTYLKDMVQYKDESENISENKFTANLSTGNSTTGSKEKGKMIILYSVRLPESVSSNPSFTNRVSLNSNGKDYTIRLLDIALPDLF